jgi:hypothetical protein
MSADRAALAGSVAVGQRRDGRAPPAVECDRRPENPADLASMTQTRDRSWRPTANPGQCRLWTPCPSAPTLRSPGLGCHASARQPVVVRFDGVSLSSDSGLPAQREVAERYGLAPRHADRLRCRPGSRIQDDTLGGWLSRPLLSAPHSPPRNPAHRARSRQAA